MIDTVKFEIPIEEQYLRVLERRATSLTKFDHESDSLVFQIYRGDIPMGSYNRRVNIFLDSESKKILRLELSLPKYVYGHNIWLFYPSQVESTLTSLKEQLSEYYNIPFPEVKFWLLTRLDLCYSWKFESEEFSESLLSVLKSFDFPRKKTAIWETSIGFIGTAYTVKYYLKRPEFFKHDFKVLSKSDIEFAYNALDWASGVLRFEVTLRKPAISTLFHKDKVYFDSLTYNNCLEGLNYYLKKSIMQFNPTLIEEKVVFERLRQVLDDHNAYRLWIFWREWISSPLGRENIRKSFGRMQIWRNIHDLSKYGIGLPKGDLPEDFKLSIPSQFVTNEDPVTPGVAVAA